jgi:eukaryotic-like serine/threonine-protein kinase
MAAFLPSTIRAGNEGYTLVSPTYRRGAPMLATGAKLGSYEIIKSLGAGGMGEVYKARDTRLNRAVALKLLLDSSRERPDIRQRFKREAEAIAGLNHPHICTLYDVSEHDGTDFLVMEFVEGETLASCLEKGPLQFDKALGYAIEIADALSKAHRQGIVHRDLKPSNIMITAAGIKLLDFGLAKLDPVASDGMESLSALPTRTTPLTGEGTLLGTLQYMAPEQLEGRDADSRSDIFAFGTTVYEMLSGRKAFEARSQASLIGAILHTEPPPLLELQPAVSPALDWAIRVCLAKDPDARWQTAHDLTLQLQRIRAAGDSAVAGRTSAKRRWWMQPAALTAAVAAAIGATAATATLRFRGGPPPAQLVARFGQSVDPGQALALELQRAVQMSPDGRRLAYVAARRGKTQVYVRSLDQDQAMPVSGTEGGSDPFFSPDGQWIGFSANGQLKKISLAGGAPIRLTDAPITFGASWGPDDSIVYVPTPVSGIHRIRSDGTTLGPVTTLDSSKGELAHRWPHILPGGKAVLFTVWRGGTFDDAHLAVHRLDTGERFTILEGGMDGRYSPTGHLIFARGASVMAVPFDLSRLRTTGAPVPIISGLETNAVTGAAHFAFSNNGSLAFVPGTKAKYRLVEVDHGGAPRELSVPERIFNQPRISPDGRRVAFAVRGVDTDIWLSDLERGGMTRLTSEPGENETPVWSPDGLRIAYSSSRAGQPRTIFSRPADSSGKEEALRTSQLASHLSSWSRDGVLAFTEFKGADGDLWVLPVGRGGARTFLATPFNEHGAMFSPDGKWLAYTSDESGQDEVYVRPYPGPGGKTQISTDGGSEPAWARTGTELFYRNDDKLIAVSIRTESVITAMPARVLFNGVFETDHRGDTNYDVSLNGRHFILIKSQRQFSRYNLVMNWFEDLRAR